jgi:methylated-DNA-[protein]-cysteine S-methyltransferase
MIAASRAVELYAFESELGWMAALCVDGQLAQLSFGETTPQAASRQLDASLISEAGSSRRLPTWTRLLQRYAAGKRVDLGEIPLRLPEPLTPFQKRVLELCRKIPYGQVATYGELAMQAGHERAARAVGNVMAANRVPLVIPCHRVVPAGGQLGRYSAAGGVRTKLRLLEMEGLVVPPSGGKCVLPPEGGTTNSRLMPNVHRPRQPR